jgi:hypothetical protein
LGWLREPSVPTSDFGVLDAPGERIARRRYGLLLISIAQARARFGGDTLLATAPGFLRRREIAERVRVIGVAAHRGRLRCAALAVAAFALGSLVACDTPAPVMPTNLTLPGLAFRSSPMPTKAEILAWLEAHPQLLEFDSTAVERFDEAAMRRAFGVTKMPELLTDGMAIDRAIREAFAAESPGKPIRGSVRIEIDIDATGHVLEWRRLIHRRCRRASMVLSPSRSARTM